MQKQTKTDRIKGFVAAGLDNATIAKRVGCSKEYVRAVKKRTREPAYAAERARAYYAKLRRRTASQKAA